MNILIVEDEPLAASQLAAHISVLEPTTQVLAVCDTVKSTVEWLQSHAPPDLIFLDIHLGDGLSFAIFNELQLSCPIVFTTAFDQYALQAFQVNSIDYLLKPINKEDLKRTLGKWRQLTQSSASPISTQVLDEIRASLKEEKYKERFLVKVGVHLRIVTVEEVCFFYSFEKGTYAKLNDGKDYLLDQSLEMTEAQIDPKAFFRINRKYLVALKSIQEVVVHSNSRLKLSLNQSQANDLIVARERVSEFKVWLGG